jgi:Arc/MetJ-type ribon-helix-helix transcriptional regulator
MTIHLPKNLENSVLATVRGGRYATVDEAMTDAARLLIERLNQEEAGANQPARTHKPIWEEIAEIAAGVPDEEWAKLPSDGAEQHDHYIYGTAKRPPSQ